MNQLFYNGAALHELGVLRILGQNTSRTPDEVRREKVTIRCHLQFFNNASYAANQQAVDTVRAALRTQNAVLLWEDPAGGVKLNREVFVADDAQPDADNAWGTHRMAMEFSFWFYRYDVVDPVALACSFTRSGSSTAIDLGVITHFSDRFATARYNELRDARSNSVGTVSLSGRWVVTDETKTIAQKRVLLLAQKAAMDAALVSQSRGRLLRPGVFDATVRVGEFVPVTNELLHCIDWTFTGTYTRFPNEDNYALVDINCQMRSNPVTGVVTRSLSGRIGAQSLDAALTKRDLLRTAFGLDGQYVLMTQEPSQHHVDTVSAGTAESGDPAGEGVFIELTVNEEWQLCGTGGDLNVVDYSFRKMDSDSTRSGFIRTVYSGQVRARGSTQAAAFANALAKAEALGAGQYPFLVQSDVTQAGFQDVTLTDKIITCEFSYEYQRRGTRTYFELSADVDTPTFGNTVETISGYIAAPSRGVALTAYNDEIASLYSGALILNERKPSAVVDWQQKVGAEEQWDRFTFALQVHRARPSGTVAVRYEVLTHDDFVGNLSRRSVEGMFWTDTEVNAAAALATFLAALALGNQVSLRKSAGNLSYTSAGTTTGFMGLGFTAEFEAALTGLTGLLLSEVTEDVVYSADRLVERAIPDAASVIQHLGTTPATRTIEAVAVGVTEAAARAWVTGLRSLLSTPESARHELPPRVRASFEFLRRTAAPVPRGGSANFTVCRVTGSFGEILTDYALPEA